MSRAEALAIACVDAVRCPTCHRDRGLACQGPRGTTIAPHDRRRSFYLLRVAELARLAAWTKDVKRPEPA